MRWKGADMAQAQRSPVLRLGVDFEASALIANLGMEAYSVARSRAEEASSDEMARDWSDVAYAIARKARRGAFAIPAVSSSEALAARASAEWPFT